MNSMHPDVTPAERDFDLLTNLLNRRGLKAKTEEVFGQCKRDDLPVSVAFLDLDNFKLVNDLTGHHTGDIVLKAFAALLIRVIGGRDIFASRYGGDEFLLLAPNFKADELHAICELLLQEMEKESAFMVPVASSVGCSVGIAAMVPQEDLALDVLIDRADAAMYIAKQGGEGKVIIYKDELLSESNLREVPFIFRGKLPLEKNMTLKITRFSPVRLPHEERRRGEKQLHAQVIELRGLPFEAENPAFLSFPCNVVGVVTACYHAQNNTIFLLAVRRAVYDRELYHWHDPRGLQELAKHLYGPLWPDIAPK